LDFDGAPVEAYLTLTKIYEEKKEIGQAIDVLERIAGRTSEIDEYLAALYLKNGQPEFAGKLTQNKLTQAKCLLAQDKSAEAFAIL